MRYRLLNQEIFTNGSYSLVPIREQDIFLLKEWRNAQMDVLRQSGLLTDEMQQKYFKDVVSKLFQMEFPPQMLFSFLENNACIGYGGLTHIDWSSSRAEVSFLLNPLRLEKATYQKEFSIFLKLLKQISFKNLKINRLFTETFDIRPDHIETLEKNGFVHEGVLREHVKIGDKFVNAIMHGCLRSSYG